MSTLNPQFLYMVLILPSLFGLALLGEGINKIVHEERGGITLLFLGFMFIGIVIIAYLLLSSYLTTHKGV